MMMSQVLSGLTSFINEPQKNLTRIEVKKTIISDMAVKFMMHDVVNPLILLEFSSTTLKYIPKKIALNHIPSIAQLVERRTVVG